MTETITTERAESAPAELAPQANAATAWLAALAGSLAAAAALATGELMSGFSQKIPSLVVGIAEIFVAETPGPIVRWSIETFGTSQKTVLVWGITITALVVGAVLGVVSRNRPVVGTVGFAVFGVVGGWAGARAALSSNGLAWLSALLAAAVGIFVLRALLARLPFQPVPEGASPFTGGGDRRAFLGIAAGAAFWAMFGSGLGRAMRRNQSVEGAREQVAASLSTSSGGSVSTVSGSLDSVNGISSIITPNEDFYLIDTAIRKPQVDPATWSMRVTGMVDNELTFSFDDLLAMDHIEEVITLSCVSNDVGGNLVGNAVWTGVPLATLLDMAGVQEGADQVVGRSVDGWAGGFPTEVALDGRPAMVALTMNGEPLPISHGFPARLVIPGLYGYVSATKWLSEVELTTWDGFDGYWIPRGWAKEGPIKTQSRVDVPRPNETVAAGPTAIAGVAWAPNRSVEMVEVRVDEGDWTRAELSDDVSENSWRQWVLHYDAAPGDHVVQVRATDGDGETQTSELASAKPDGATGWHTTRFRAE